MIPTRLDSIPARAAVAVAVAVALAVAPGCKSDLVRVTAYDTDEAVQRERYKRLGLPWDAERARADEACVLRSPLLPDVIVGGELRSERVRATGALPCDYDIAFVGLKTIVVGIDEVTDRVMIYNDWKVLDSEARAALFEAWFRVGLTAGLEVVEAAERGAIEAAGHIWSPVRIERIGVAYRASGWFRWPRHGPDPRYELRRCDLMPDLTFHGCEAVARIGF